MNAFIANTSTRIYQINNYLWGKHDETIKFSSALDLPIDIPWHRSCNFNDFSRHIELPSPLTEIHRPQWKLNSTFSGLTFTRLMSSQSHPYSINQEQELHPLLNPLSHHILQTSWVWEDWQFTPITDGYTNRLYRSTNPQHDLAIKFTLRDQHDRAGRETMLY